MILNKVIMSSNDSLYLEYWPIVSKVWKEKMLIDPILIFVGEHTREINETYGNVIKIKPFSGINVAQQCQISRIFYSTMFRDEVVLISDVDMLPLNRAYFVDKIKPIRDDCLVVYSSDAYVPGNPAYPAFPMCYLAAQGGVFSEIINSDYTNFEKEIHKWINKGYGWFTDERVFYEKWMRWENFNKTVGFSRGFNIGNLESYGRIDRSNNCSYDFNLLRSGQYIDFHMSRNLELTKNVYRCIKEYIK